MGIKVFHYIKFQCNAILTLLPGKIRTSSHLITPETMCTVYIIWYAKVNILYASYNTVTHASNLVHISVMYMINLEHIMKVYANVNICISNDHSVIWWISNVLWCIIMNLERLMMYMMNLEWISNESRMNLERLMMYIMNLEWISNESRRSYYNICGSRYIFFRGSLTFFGSRASFGCLRSQGL